MNLDNQERKKIKFTTIEITLVDVYLNNNPWVLTSGSSITFEPSLVGKGYFYYSYKRRELLTFLVDNEGRALEAAFYNVAQRESRLAILSGSIH